MGWEYQSPKEVAKVGEKKAKWYAGWRDADGRLHGKRIGSRSMAKKYWLKMETQKTQDQCEHFRKLSWSAFLEKYRKTEMVTWRSEKSRVEAEHVFSVFTQVARPTRVDSVDAAMLDRYVARRLRMPGKRKGETVRAATIRKELRTVRAALNKGKRWKHLLTVPEMPEVEGFEKDKPFVTAEHFDQMMGRCGVAHLPADQLYSPVVFWRALLAMLWVTGMRKGALLAMLWEDVDLETGRAWSRAEDNKAKRDEWKDITGAVPFLQVLQAKRREEDPRVFPWPHTLRTLDRELARIQRAAEIDLPCREQHEHTPACHLYGFHSFRYAHATYNYGNPRLQQQMGHASETMTRHYVKYAKDHQKQPYNPYLTEGLKKLQAG